MLIAPLLHTLNETKTELIILTSPRKNLSQEPDIRIKYYKLKLHSYVKYLGILVNEVLPWNNQIESICMKLARANGILSKLRYFVPKDIFYSHLTYGYLVRSYSRKSNIDRLTKQQKRCIRIINFSDSNSHTDPQYSELKLLKVNDIFLLSKLLFMFDFIKENILEDLKRLFIFNKSVHSYETHSSQMFHIPKEKTSRFGLNTLNCDGAKLWRKFFYAFLQKETDLTKSNLKNFIKNTFP